MASCAVTFVGRHSLPSRFFFPPFFLRPAQIFANDRNYTTVVTRAGQNYQRSRVVERKKGRIALIICLVLSVTHSGNQDLSPSLHLLLEVIPFILPPPTRASSAQTRDDRGVKRAAWLASSEHLPKELLPPRQRSQSNSQPVIFLWDKENICTNSTHFTQKMVFVFVYGQPFNITRVSVLFQPSLF